jgi:hypothetical protein
LRVYLAVAAIAVAGIGVHDLGAFTDAQIHVDSTGELAGGTPPVFVKALGAVALATLAIIAGAWVVRLLRRYRSATGDLREQLKWLISGGGLCIAGFGISILLNSAHGEPWYAIAQAAPFSIAALPLSIGVGVLKYRLYEIDRLISRTLSYAIVTGTLVAVFVVIVSLTTDVLPFSSPIGVAASTLVAAALFNPLRRRVQHVLDRRFNRVRYDAETILAGFSGRLRETVDLATLERELLTAVNLSLAPGHASLWIKPPV